MNDFVHCPKLTADVAQWYGSPHHSRSQSVKAARSRTGERQLLGLPSQRARVASMPNTGVEEEYYRLRHFSITGKGVINRGDSLRSRRSRSNTSVASSASSTEAITRASAPCSLASSRDSSAGLSAYRVLVIGASGVGKSSLVGQFMTSEYLHAYDTSIDDESGERSVCVLLAGEESEITFLDNPPDHVISDGCAHGYCVVYSTADRGSFVEAERRLQILWAAGHTSRRAVILVGNKADLARSRAVPTDEGKILATSYECKFIETSVGINHNVDELLVGLLTQIRLKQQQAERVRKRSNSRKNRSRARSPMEVDPPASAPPTSISAASTPRKRTRLSASVKVRGLLGRVWARDSKSKSCENLHVL
ncbi:ras family domain-containing protein [Phthorimaea operculella]|nr:ras family domain-containing protein [Phthorimaea operculella]